MMASMGSNPVSLSIAIEAPVARVWDALTRPELVRQYLFGTEMTADWRVGGAITYRGEWKGAAYEDKGTVMIWEPQRLLVTSYYSPLSGLEDRPENYQTVSWKLSATDRGTTLTLTQDNNPIAESAEHAGKKWDTVLTGLKRLLEKRPVGQCG